ncbi:hypothetical protein GOODEAATRI_002354 [Goodea atripinnis]|uniref:Uncharacterized protein n=1 Tax=Goodea atripinnis TaxID=208336 RepID=A0ABV0NJA9_9TELE
MGSKMFLNGSLDAKVSKELCISSGRGFSASFSDFRVAAPGFSVGPGRQFAFHLSVLKRSSHDCGLLVFCGFMTSVTCCSRSASIHPSIPPFILSGSSTPAASYLIHS